MALNLSGLKRIFKYNGQELSDPEVSLTPEEVMEFYSGIYPDLTTSNVHGPKVVDGQAIYEFKTTVGTKG